MDWPGRPMECITRLGSLVGARQGLTYIPGTKLRCLVMLCLLESARSTAELTPAFPCSKYCTVVLELDLRKDYLKEACN